MPAINRDREGWGKEGGGGQEAKVRHGNTSHDRSGYRILGLASSLRDLRKSLVLDPGTRAVRVDCVLRIQHATMSWGRGWGELFLEKELD